MATGDQKINPIRHEEMIKQPNVKAGREVMTESRVSARRAKTLCDDSTFPRANSPAAPLKE
jgi:hypothetical protein